MSSSAQLVVAIGIFILQLLPAFADDVITNVMSPVVSYQYYDSFGEDTNATVLSPVASYQYFDWPGDDVLNLKNSPVVSYFFQFGNSFAQIILHGRVTDTNGTPLSGATVSAMIYLSPVAEATTGVDGNYQISYLSAGVYDLSAWDATHQTSMRGLTLNVNTAEQNFQLKPLPPTPVSQQVKRSATFQFPPIGSLGEILEIFNGSVFTNISPDNMPSPDLMTIVLTHGWNSDPTVWAQNMASNMVAKGVSANVLAFDWRFASDGPYPPEEYTPAEGVLLGQSLQSELGADYSQPIHFIGHSLGTMVNAAAANYLQGDQTAQQGVSATPWKTSPIHVTLLDEAEAASLLDKVGEFFDGLTVQLINLGVPLTSPPSGASQGWKSPIPIHSTWADNYVSKFGFYHSDAVNVQLDRAIIISGVKAQHAYSYQWYGMTVTNPADCFLGFQRSYEARTANLSAFDFPPSTSDFPEGVSYEQLVVASDPLTLTYQPTISQTLGSLATTVVQGATDTAQTVGNVAATIENTAQNAAQFISQEFDYVSGVASQDGQTVVNFFSSAVLQLTLTTVPPTTSSSQLQSMGSTRPMGIPSDNSTSNMPPMIWLPIYIPANTTAMAFDFAVNGDPVDDWLVCGIETNDLFLLEAKYIPTNQFSASRLIDVSAWAGGTNELFFGLMGSTSTNATLKIQNIRFYSLQPPQLAIAQTGNGISIAWPNTAGGRVVQTTTNLTTSVWETVTNVPSILNDCYSISNSWPDQMRFFRLW